MSHYVASVTNLLAGEFGLSGIFGRQALWETVEMSVSQEIDHLEFILDNPSSANWRLKVNYPWMPRGLRVSCYKTFPTPEDAAREERVNATLAELAAEEFKGTPWFRRRRVLAWGLIGLQLVLLLAMAVICGGWIW